MNRDTDAPDSESPETDGAALHTTAADGLDEFSRAVLATLSEPVLTIDEERRIVFANAAVERAFGHVPDDLVGEQITTVVPEWARDVYRDGIEAYLRGDDEPLDWGEVETPGRHRDGHDLALRISWSAVETDEGHRFTGIVRDVTERKRRVRELEQFAAIGHAVADGIYALDAEGRYLMVNDAYAEMSGYDREELLGTPAAEVTGTEANRRATELYEQLVDVAERGTADRSGTGDADRGDDLATLETEFPGPDGDSIPIEARMALFPLEDGTTGRVGVVRDITERKQFEATMAALHESSRDLLHVGTKDEVARSVLETAVDVLDLPGVGIYLYDESEDVLYPSANSPYIEDIFGEMPSFGPDDDSITRQAFVDGAVRAIDDVAESALTYWDDTPLRSGVWIPLADHGVIAIVSEEPGAFDRRIRRLADLLAATAESALDRVERERARNEYERRLEETVRELETSNERLERFAYVASHDLKEPLRMVSSYLGLLERRYGDELDEDAGEFIDFAVDGAERMRDMIDDLLAYSRIDTHGDPFEPVDCDDVLAQTLDNLRIAVSESDATVEVGDLPTVTGDENQLIQLFQNLVENAIKYAGEKPPRIDVSATRRGDEWWFAVSDDGIGMSPDDTEQIFDIFSRLHRGDDYGGTGIGLSLCRKIVERHGGDIEVDSEPGEGSTFRFGLPAADAE